MDDTTDRLERLVRLESWARYERERTDHLIASLQAQAADLSRRLQVLETPSIPLGSTTKLILAGLIVLLAILAPSDIKGAIRLLGSG